MKAQLDVIFATAIIFVILVGIGVAIMLNNNLTNALQPIYNSTQAGQIILSKQSQVNTIFANAIVILYFALCFAALISAFITESSPFFSILIFFLIPIQLLISFVFHDMFLQLVADSNFAFLANNFYIQSLFLNLPLITLIISGIILVVVYAK